MQETAAKDIQKEMSKTMSLTKHIENFFEKIIFTSRWVQAPIYGGLIVGAGLYTFKFLMELIHLCATINTISEEILMLGILTLVDISMVLNLLVMVIIGGYSTFVSRIHLEKHEDRPDWLEKINAGTLKVKLAGALVGISGIHLLKSFIDISKKDFEQVKWQIIIHLVFLVSTLALAYTEKILHSAEDHSAKPKH